MPGILRRIPIAAVDQLGKPFWSDTRSLIQRNAVTPIISNFTAASLFGGDALALNLQAWADTQLPLSDEESRDLARVAQVWNIQQNDPRKTKGDYLRFLKEILFNKAVNDPELDEQTRDDVMRPNNNAISDKSVSEFAQDLGYPRVSDPNQDALRLLAELPLPLYITTCYHEFIEQALISTGYKKPESEILYWNQALENIPSIYDRESGYRPDEKRPLVYHLFGRDAYPESLILTEDDYLDWLVRLAEMRGEVNVTKHQGNQRIIPDVVRTALSMNALLVLGFGTYSLDFRVLFRSLIIGIGAGRKENKLVPRGICMQIDRVAKTKKQQKLARDYAEKYFEQMSRFDVFWGNEKECVLALMALWKAGN
jgi:hypothetical protein